MTNSKILTPGQTWSGLWLIIAFNCGMLQSIDADIVTEPLLELGFGGLTTMAASADGKYLATGGQGVFLWDAKKYTPIRTLDPNDEMYVIALTFSEDDKRLFCGCANGTVRLLDIATGKSVKVFVGHTERADSVALSLDGKLLVTGSSSDKTTRVWDTETGETRRVLQWNDTVTAVAISPDGRKILTGCSDGTAKMWVLTNPGPVSIFNGHTRTVNAVDFSPDGRFFLTASDDGTVKIWKSDRSQTWISEVGDQETEIVSATFSPDGSLIMTGGYNGSVKLWDSGSADEIATLTRPENIYALDSVLFAVDGANAFIATSSGVRKLEFATNTWTGEFRGHSSGKETVEFSPDGSLVLSGVWSVALQLWDTRTGILAPTVFKDNGSSAAARFSSTGERVVVASVPDHIIRLFDLATEEMVQQFIGHDLSIRAVAISPDASMIVSGGADKVIKLWNVESGELLHEIPINRVIDSLDFSFDNTLFAAAAFGKAMVFDATDGALINEFRELIAPKGSVAFSPTDFRLLTGNITIGGPMDHRSAGVKMWNAKTGEELITFSGHDSRYSIRGVDLSSDGKEVITAGGDGTVRLWDALTGEELHQFVAAVSSVAFSPDGNMIVTGGSTGTGQVRLWEIPGRSGRIKVSVGNGEDKELTWDRGTLQKSDDLREWVDLPGATSPTTVDPSSTREFFRLRFEAK